LRATPSSDDLKAAIDAFLELVESPPENAQWKLRALAAALDRLAVVYHSIEDIEPTSDKAETEPRDHAIVYQRLAKLFPEFGIYAEVEPATAYRGSLGEPLMGDAVDDLQDIAGDLYEVAALLRKGEVDNATWQFRFSFESHWGRHLRSLQGYVHYLIHRC
jgi:hypothetical protein